MDQFQVDVRFPKDKNSNVVTIQGLEENVEDAKYHLLTLAEDYVCMHTMYLHFDIVLYNIIPRPADGCHALLPVIFEYPVSMVEILITLS